MAFRGPYARMVAEVHEIPDVHLAIVQNEMRRDLISLHSYAGFVHSSRANLVGP